MIHFILQIAPQKGAIYFCRNLTKNSTIYNYELTISKVVNIIKTIIVKSSYVTGYNWHEPEVYR